MAIPPGQSRTEPSYGSLKTVVSDSPEGGVLRAGPGGDAFAGAYDCFPKGFTN